MLKSWGSIASSHKTGMLPVVIVLAAAVFLAPSPLPPHMRNRVYRIGIDSSPTLTEIQEVGKPIGLAVELKTRREGGATSRWTGFQLTFYRSGH